MQRIISRAEAGMRIREELRLSKATCFMVGIDGLSGSGKSTLARYLSEELGIGTIIHSDDFASWEEPFGWEARCVKEALLPLSRGEGCRYRCSSWDGSPPAERILPPTTACIAEGVGFLGPDFVPFFAFTLWVETFRALRLSRGLARDGKASEAKWRAWMDAEDEFVARENPKARARYLISGTETV